MLRGQVAGARFQLLGARFQVLGARFQVLAFPTDALVACVRYVRGAGYLLETCHLSSET